MYFIHSSLVCGSTRLPTLSSSLSPYHQPFRLPSAPFNHIQVLSRLQAPFQIALPSSSCPSFIPDDTVRCCSRPYATIQSHSIPFPIPSLIPLQSSLASIPRVGTGSDSFPYFLYNLYPPVASSICSLIIELTHLSHSQFKISPSISLLQLSTTTSFLLYHKTPRPAVILPGNPASSHLN